MGTEAVATPPKKMPGPGAAGREGGDSADAAGEGKQAEAGQAEHLQPEPEGGQTAAAGSAEQDAAGARAADAGAAQAGGAAGSAAGGGGKSATAAAAAQAKTLRKETDDLMGDAMAGIESTQI